MVWQYWKGQHVNNEKTQDFLFLVFTELNEHIRATDEKKRFGRVLFRSPDRCYSRARRRQVSSELEIFRTLALHPGRRLLRSNASIMVQRVEGALPRGLPIHQFQVSA